MCPLRVPLVCHNSRLRRQGRRGRGGIRAELAVGPGTHLKYEGSAARDVGVPEPELVIGLPVEGHRLDVAILRRLAFGFHRERGAWAHFHYGAVEQRGAENVV